MALTTTTTRTDSVGDDSTLIFPFTWRCDSAAWVHVYLDLVEQFSGFTVALNANQDSSPGGSVTFSTAPAQDVEVRVARIVPLTQETVLTPYSPFAAKTVERALDRTVMQQQQYVASDPTAQAIASAAEAAASAGAAAAEAVAADANAAAASASAGAASSSAASANADRILAEAAADAASAAGLIFADTTALLAALADGEYGWVPAGPSQPDVLILYREQTGVAVEQGRLVASATVAALQAALTPGSPSTGGLFYICDSVGRVIAYWDADSGLQLYGRDGVSVQTRLAELDNLRAVSSSPTSHFTVVDNLGRMVAYIDSAGGLRLVGRTESIQDSVHRLEAVSSGYASAGAGGSVVLPLSGFVPGGRALRGEERWVYGGTPAGLRPNETTVTAMPFYWVAGSPTYDLVVPSQMRVRQGTVNTARGAEPFTWGAEQAITVNAPTGFFDDADASLRRQIRDGSLLYDRATGYYYYADSGITGTAYGWKSVNCPIFRSSDLTTWDFLSYGPQIGDGVDWQDRVWQPNWFVSPEGTVYLIGAAYVDNLLKMRPWIWRCDNVTTMATWTDLGPVTGSAFPVHSPTGAIWTIDTLFLCREGVYFNIWKAEAETVDGTEEKSQLGIAWSTSLLGPYNNGQRFTAPTGELIKGEGSRVLELPPGGPYRWRLLFDNYEGRTYGGITSPHMCCDTNDWVTFSPVRSTGFSRPADTIYQRNTPFIIGA